MARYMYYEETVYYRPRQSQKPPEDSAGCFTIIVGFIMFLLMGAGISALFK